MALLNYVMMALVAIAAIVGLRMFYVWYTTCSSPSTLTGFGMGSGL